MVVFSAVAVVVDVVLVVLDSTALAAAAVAAAGDDDDEAEEEPTIAIEEALVELDATCLVVSAGQHYAAAAADPQSAHY